MDKQHYIPSDDNNEGTYQFYSELAAKAERDSVFHVAEVLWLKARKVAKHPNNGEWADKRAMFCRRMKERPGMGAAA